MNKTKPLTDRKSQVNRHLHYYCNEHSNLIQINMQRSFINILNKLIAKTAEISTVACAYFYFQKTRMIVITVFNMVLVTVADLETLYRKRPGNMKFVWSLPVADPWG